jgi:uncharacterized protein (TIGR03546 family)
MLTLLSLIRKIFKNLKSDLTPAQIGVGAALGALAGLTPFGLHLLLIFTVALLFNCSMAVFLLVFGLFKPLGLMFGGTSFAVGVSLLSDPNGFYAALIGWASNAPVLAYMGFERYVVAGGYAMATPVSLVVGVLSAQAVVTYRARLAPKMADAAWYQKAMTKWYFRAFKWLIAGKEKEAVAPKKRFVLLRPFRAYMAGFIPLLYVGLTVGAGLYAQAAIDGLAAGSLRKALGVDVRFSKIEYSFFGQRLAFENFQMPDPQDTKTDLLRVGGFKADLGFVSLLSKRLHIEELELRDVATRVVRSSDGKLNLTQVPAAKPADPAEEKAWNEYLDGLMKKGQETDWAEVWKKYQAYKKEGEAKKKEEEAAGGAAKKKVALTYDPALAWSPPWAGPAARIDVLKLSGFALDVEDKSRPDGKLPPLRNVGGTMERFSTAIGWDGQPLAMDLSGDLGGGKIKLSGTWKPGTSKLDLKLENLALLDYRPLYEKSLPVKVEGGTALISTAAGTAEGRIDGRTQLTIEKLKIAAKPGTSTILGLDPEMSGYAIQGINAYGEKLPVAVEAGLKGPLEDPSIDAKLPFLEIAKQGLEMLGKAELKKYADRLGGEAEKLKKAALDPAAKEAEKAVESLKKGDVKSVEESIKKVQTDAKKPEDVKKEAEKSVEGIKDLFKKK